MNKESKHISIVELHANKVSENKFKTNFELMTDYIECFSVHYKNGESKIFCADEMDRISEFLMSEEPFLFAVFKLKGEHKPLIAHAQHELFA